jgi:hypothetical protein
VYRGSNVFDYGVQDFSSRRDPAGTTAPDAAVYRTVVVARRLGEAIHPVDILTTFRNGATKTERWEGRDRRAIYSYDGPSQAESVQIDPQRLLLLDVNYTNNSATLEPRSGEASLKWTLKWVAWLQDLMLTWAFLV